MRPRIVSIIGALALVVSATQVRAQFLKGFDVYSGDGAVDWVTAKNSGITFAFVKASQGYTGSDSRFTANMQGATNAGVYVGPYHFCNINSDRNGNAFTTYDGAPFAVGGPYYADAQDEALHFLSAVRPYYLSGSYLPPVADVEGLPDFGNATLNKTFISNWVQIFSDTILNALGTRPMIYTSKSKANEIYTSTVAAEHKLWIAWWKGTGTTSPPVQSDTPLFPLWSFWQYTNLESVPGVPGSEGPPTYDKEDGDVFNGSVRQLTGLLVHNVPGDYNHNGTVDMGDYVVWRNSKGSTTSLAADGNLSGTVDSTDFTYWRSRFGLTSGSGAGDLSSGVPEPTTAWLGFTGLAISAQFLRRRPIHTL